MKPKKSVPSPSEARAENEIFIALRALCKSPGYIHAIAYFCWRDNLIRYRGEKIVAKDLQHQYSSEKLVRTEISTLIGLMVQHEIDFSLPSSSVLSHYVGQTEALLIELHQALTKPWFVGWDIEAGKLPESDPFADAAAMREPIFYCSESAYSFQYEHLAAKKYEADNPWLDANMGFRIEEVSRLGAALGPMLVENQLRCVAPSQKQPREEWTVLPGFLFTAEEASKASGVSLEKTQLILDAFSYRSDARNETYSALNEFNAVNSTPILKTASEQYILLQYHSLLEAIYETPFFWMTADKSYTPTALTNRGQFTERFVGDRLEVLFLAPIKSSEM